MRHRVSFAAIFLCVLLLIALPASTTNFAFGEDVDFRRDVQPILAQHCFTCHGPDANERKADLRLDQKEGALSVINLKSPEDSELVNRIHSSDPDEQMPPAEFNKPLDDSQKQILLSWIKAGAPWQNHWAFEAIQTTTPPQDPSGWSQNPIDKFLIAQMQKHQLSPSAAADDSTRLRRVYFDLIGIAPTPQQVAEFATDRDPEKWSHTIDRLMASPHYGERMAVSWLDLARYADTNGYQNDFVRSMWPWRNWVIEAFNRKMPMDQFIVEQIAGDLLPNPTESQLIATGFNRNNHSVTEGGTIEEEWRIENCIDRVETTSATFLGITMGCARCHDHKYDPISQREFYQFFAFFNNVDEKGVYNEFRGNTQPLIKVPTDEQKKAMSDVELQLAELTTKLNDAVLDSDTVKQKLTAWQSEIENAKINNNGELTKPTFTFNPNTSQDLTQDPAKGPAQEPVHSPVGSVGKLHVEGNPLVIPSPPEYEFKRDQPFSWSVWIEGGSTGSIFGKMNDQPYRGVDGIILGDGRLKIHLISAWPENSIAVIAQPGLAAGRWYHVGVTYDGTSKAAGLKVYIDNQTAKLEIERDSLTDAIDTEEPFRIGQRRNSVFFDGRMLDFRLFASTLSAEQMALQWKSSLAGSQPESVALKNYLSSLQSKELQQQIDSLTQRKNDLAAAQQTTMIMKEREGYRETYRLNRGQYDQPDQTEKLWPTIPSALPPLSADQPANRLGLARWLVDDRNPLVARVIANREWTRFFGRGLVDTPDNFGLQGSPPSHPELLDWLANDFRTHGWNLQHLQKQILLSAAYQQDSKARQDLIEKDRENRWLARGPRHRLSAEQIRDHALAISGLLVDTIGGPSVFPYQPAGLWEELAGGANNGPYVQSHGDDLYRRTLYTYRKRTVPHPVTSTMDAPGWEICQVKRARTNTPLQALALLNDVTYVEAARVFAQRILNEGGNELEDQLNYAANMTLGRSLSADDLETLKDGYTKYLKFYRDDKEAAKALLEMGEHRGDCPAPVEQQAAMATIASVLMNMDEAITKQ